MEHYDVNAVLANYKPFFCFVFTIYFIVQQDKSLLVVQRLLIHYWSILISSIYRVMPEISDKHRR